jgi:MFS family permease
MPGLMDDQAMIQIASAVRPRGWYYGWNITAVCILSQIAANGLTYNTYSLFLRDWSSELHAPISQLQLPVAAMALVAALLSPFVGALADKYPARRLLGFGLLGIAVFYIAISTVTQAWQILALYGLLVPLALCLSTAVTANALISRWFVRRLGLALGLSAFGIGMAGVLLPPVIAAILPTVGGWRVIWRDGGLVVALLVLPLVVAVARNRPTEADGNYYLSSDGQPAKPHGHAPQAGGMRWREVLARRNFWLLVGIYVPMLALYGGLAQNLAPYAANHGLSQQSAGILLSVLSFAHVISTLVLGLLSDRFGNRLPFAGLAIVMVSGATIVAFGAGFPTLAAGCALVGLGGGLFTLLAAAVATEFGAEGFGRAFGLCMLFVPLTSIAPFATAKTQESTGSYVPALLGLSILVLISGALSLLLRERGRGDSPAGASLQPAVTENRF